VSVLSRHPLIIMATNKPVKPFCEMASKNLVKSRRHWYRKVTIVGKNGDPLSLAALVALLLLLLKKY
jgi:hypothetical protein